MTRKQALQYIVNTRGGATIANFIDDWEPVGGMEWDLLEAAGLVCVKEGHIFLTKAGEEKLASL